MSLQETLDQFVGDYIEGYMKNVHTCLPAEIVKIHADSTIDVVPLIKRKIDNKIEDLPYLEKVPLRMMKCRDFIISMPLQVGDSVVLLFIERRIDNWLLTGKKSDPDSHRMFSLSDAFAVPLMYPQTDAAVTVNQNDLEIRTLDGTAKISIKPDGEVNISGTQIRISGNTIVDNLKVAGHVHKYLMQNGAQAVTQPAESLL